MLSASTTLRAASMRQARPGSAVRPARLAGACTAPCKPVLTMVRATPQDEDSEAMLKDNWGTVYTDKDIKQGNIEGHPVGDETVMKAQDIGQGKMEPHASNTEGVAQPTGTEYGAATEERTSSGGADTGRQSQQMSDAPAVSEEGGRFDEEQQPGNHPYDPRPRERGHGVPPHKDASNTGPGPAAGSDPMPQSESRSAGSGSQGETTDTSARDQFQRDQM